MLPAWRKSGQCVFCAFRSFSTLPARRRAAHPSRRARESQRLIGKLDHDEQRAIAHRKIRKHAAGDSKFSAITEYPHELSFKPNKGQNFTRRKIGGHEINGDAIRRIVRDLETELVGDVIFERLKISHKRLRRLFKSFSHSLILQMRSGPTPSSPLLNKLLEMVRSGQEDDARVHMKYAFYDNALSSSAPEKDSRKLQKLESLTDLRHPYEWYPATRAFPREFHVHVGPTNSGKTYHALKRLEESETGVYAGPLRLLAHEVYMRLNAKNQRCNLITGDDRRTADQESPRASKMSCTVEMVPLNTAFDVAVIDEIQMLGSPDRGWAWTQALLGVMAREVHVCGEERSVSIIEQIAAACGEKVHVHRYNRLSPLKLARNSLNGDLQQLRKGDCIVGFSIVILHGLRQEIEKTLGKRCAIIYGSLPPETRAQQAALFNDPDNEYDFLVASNAVGMGLNLNIKRLVFQSLHKNMRGRLIPIEVPEIKQIAGRAGRYSTAADDMKREQPNQTNPPALDEAKVRSKSVGFATTLEKYDFPLLVKAMDSNPAPLTAAGLFPPSFVIERFARYFPPETPFSFLLFRISELAEAGPRFFVSDMSSNIAIADTIEPVQGLSIKDREIFCSAPIEPKKPGQTQLARAYARTVADCTGKSVLDYEELDIELLEEKYTASREYLLKIERLHKGLVIFMWLTYRFNMLFLDRDLAIHIRSLTEKRIEDTLAQLSFDFKKFRKSREQAVLEMLDDWPRDANSEQPGARTPSLLSPENRQEIATAPQKEADAKSKTPDDSNHQDDGLVDPLTEGSGAEHSSFYEDNSIHDGEDYLEQENSTGLEGLSEGPSDNLLQRGSLCVRENTELQAGTETTLNQPGRDRHGDQNVEDEHYVPNDVKAGEDARPP